MRQNDVPATDQKLGGKTALVTGASSGIGRGVALAFAAHGARVAVNFPTADEQSAAETVCQRITDDGGVAQAIMGDVAEEAQVAAMMSEAEQRLGPIDILVNNAGIAHTAPLEDIPVTVWDRVLAVHLRGTFLCTRAVLPAMYERGFGRIINTASQLAYKGSPGLTHYTAAKGAILAMTRSLALEAGARNVTINCVAPGATLTPILDSVPDELLEQIRASIPLGRMAQVADIVPSYVFLASQDGSHYQGQCLSPNGGDVFL
ncbi:MAG: SDR family NAD(P)-dependent oxidoreductase [Gammaproteobacteria bacterium]